MNILRRIDWKVLLFYLAMSLFCFICWLGIFKFVKLIAKAQGWQ